MKKKFLALLLILCICLFAGCNAFTSDIEYVDYRGELSKTEQYLNNVNLITNKIMPSNVSVVTTLESLKGITTEQGSGVIFKKTVLQNKTFDYYVLTNYHVVKIPNEQIYIKKELKVADYKGVKQSASVIFYDSKYDLAMVKFTSTVDYYVMPLASANPKENDIVYAVGQPLGQYNAISVGKVKSYDTTNFDYDWCEIDFACIMHSAKINNGNSGGMLLNDKLDLCGINFAVGKTSSSVSISESSLAIPIVNVKEFIKKSGINATL